MAEQPTKVEDEATIMAWADDYLAVNNEPCRFDHHGGCQAHGYLSLEPGERCPEGAAIEAHQRLAYGAVAPTSDGSDSALVVMKGER